MNAGLGSILCLPERRDWRVQSSSRGLAYNTRACAVAVLAMSPVRGCLILRRLCLLSWLSRLVLSCLPLPVVLPCSRITFVLPPFCSAFLPRRVHRHVSLVSPSVSSVLSLSFSLSLSRVYVCNAPRASVCMTIQDMIDGHLDPSVEHLPINSRTQVSFVRLACLSCPRDVFFLDNAMPFFASCPLVIIDDRCRSESPGGNTAPVLVLVLVLSSARSS